MWQETKNLYHLAQAAIAAAYFRFPSKRLTVIGVTGTDGKTTTTAMIHKILKDLGQKVAMISSVEAIVNDKAIDTGFHVTTPNPWQIQKLLKKAADTGSNYFVLEATSHGLDQNRLAFIDFYLGVLTNITREHMDYHKTLKHYISSKAKLFKHVKYSILNFDDNNFIDVKNLAGGGVLSYSLASTTADFNQKNVTLKLKIKGYYNIQNALAAFTAVQALGFPKARIIDALNDFKGVKGRFEEVDLDQPYLVVVDFAHTPNSLENVLNVLKSELKAKSNRLIAVFGAAGQRDKSKRQKLGEVSAKFADITVITSEDPRNEDPIKIAQEIAKGLEIKGKKEGIDFFIVTDRKKAIEFAINNAHKGDVVGFFGKGHEQSMNIGGCEYPWDEVKEVEKAINYKLNYEK